MVKKTTLVIAILVFILQTVSAQTFFDKQGHRGCRGLLPENTIPAMKKAVDLGATLEMDISFSKEKIAIVSHDQNISSIIALKPSGDTISKAEEKKLILYQMPYSQIRQFILGQKIYPKFPEQKQVKTYIPVLADLIDSVEAYSKQNNKPLPKYNIETKTTAEGDNVLHPGPEEFVNLLMKVILNKGIEKRVIIQSFDDRTLEIIHLKYPYMQTALLVSKNSLSRNLAMLSFSPTIYSPDYKLIDENLIKECHAKRIKVIPWTVDDIPTIKLLKDWGVDGIISDYPNLL